MEAKKESPTNFHQVPSFEHFNIVYNGVLLDSQLSEHHKTKYYELCCSQGMILHGRLECQNYNFAIVTIRETIKIAEAIRASNITTPPDTLLKWRKSLEGFEMFGMKVSFLLDKLDELMDLSSKSMSNSKRYTQTRIKRDQAEEAKKNLELKLEEVNKNISRLGVELNSQNMSLQQLGAEFQHLANAPW